VTAILFGSYKGFREIELLCWVHF